MSKNLIKVLSIFISFCLILEQSVFAQAIDLSHYFVHNSNQNIPQGDKFRPLHLRYLGYDNLGQDFKILLDKGDTKKEDLENKTYIEDNTQTLLKYFFIGLALPNEKFWVNLMPDSPDNILDPDLEKTDIGRIFLEADLQLKKDTSSWTSPQNPEGKAYWDKLYKKAGELFGSENITIPTITRPWIVPNEIIIREAPDNAYIYKATLKVMLEEDYLTSRGGSRTAPTPDQYTFSDPRLKELNQYSTQLIKETIIPKLTYAVNTSKRYTPLRQVYYSLILAQCFKQKYGSLGSVSAPGTRAPVNSYIDLIDSGNLANLTSSQPYDKQSYFRQYQKSFQDGEYNLQEPVYTPMGQSIRRYMSGGVTVMDCSSVIESIPAKGDPTFASSAVEGYEFKEKKVSKLTGSLVGKGLHLPPSKLRGSLVDVGKHKDSKSSQTPLSGEEMDQINNILISGKGLDAVLRYGWGKIRKTMVQRNYASIAKKQLEDVIALEESGFKKVILPLGTGFRIDAQIEEIHKKYAAEINNDHFGKISVGGKNISFKPDTYNLRIELALSAENFPKAYDLICQAFKNENILQYVDVSFFSATLGGGESHELHRPFIIYIPYRENYDELLLNVCKSLLKVKLENPEVFRLSAEEIIYIKRVNTALFKIPLDDNMWCYEVNVVFPKKESKLSIGIYLSSYESYAIQIGAKYFKGILTEVLPLVQQPMYGLARSNKPAKEWYEKFLTTLSSMPKQTINIDPMNPGSTNRYQHMPALVAVSSAIETNDNDLLTKKHHSASSAVDTVNSTEFPNYTRKIETVVNDTVNKMITEGMPIVRVSFDPDCSIGRELAIPYSDIDGLTVIHDIKDDRRLVLAKDMLYAALRNNLIGVNPAEVRWFSKNEIAALKGKKYMSFEEKTKWGRIKLSIKYFKPLYSISPEDPIFSSFSSESITGKIEFPEKPKHSVRKKLFKEWEGLDAVMKDAIEQIHMRIGDSNANMENNIVKVNLTRSTLESLLEKQFVTLSENGDYTAEWLGTNGQFEAVIQNVSSALVAKNAEEISDVGGIAFNVLPIQTEFVASSALGALPGGRAFRGDLDAEWVRIQDVFNAGVRPSIQRISEYTAAVVASPLAEDKIDQVRVMLADILRREEEDEKIAPASFALKGLLIALESDKPASEFQFVSVK